MGDRAGLRCPVCGTANPGQARFCFNCGTGLAPPCPNCAEPLPDEAAFCPRCGYDVARRGGPEQPPTAQTAGRSARSGPAAAADRLRRYIPAELLGKLERAADGSVAGERRRVTMLFCDMVGSTTAAEDLDPEEWADLMNGAFEHLIAPIYRYEGTVARLMGDAILAFFGAPIAHEDDPERAVRAGLEILAEIEPYKQQVRRNWAVDVDVRIGINTGLVVVGAVGSDLRVEYTAMGDAVNVAARMEQTATSGTVQISDATRRSLEPLFEFEALGDVRVKGRDEPVGAHRVLRARARPTNLRGVPGLRAPLVGREAEFAALRRAADDLIASGSGGIVSIMGEAGLGKSRLVAELRDALEDSGDLAAVGWAEGHALSFEAATPFAAVRDVVRDVAGIGESDPGHVVRDRLDALARRTAPGRAGDVSLFLAGLLGLDLPEDDSTRLRFFPAQQLRNEIFRAVEEILTGSAGRRPLVLVLEDLHWADSATIDLITELLDATERAPILLLLVFRPRRDEPAWSIHELAERDHPHLHVTLELHQLDDDATRQLVASLLEIDGLPEELRATILAKAEGNPYFIEELVRSLIDEGVIRREGGGWAGTAVPSDLAVPDALHALITSRLDRLEDRAKEVAQAASVLGREFRYDELVAVLGDVDRLDDTLVELQRRDFVHEVARLPRRRFRFKHALLQESIYETLLLRTRSRLHTAAADFLERLQPERVEDTAEHLLRGRQRERALPHVVAAGDRALATHALPEAVRRYEQALEILGDAVDSDELLRRALEGLGKTHELSFDFGTAANVYERLRDEGDRRGITSMWISGQNKYSLVTGFVFGQHDEAIAHLNQAEVLARKTPDDPGLVEACMNQCYLHTLGANFELVEHYMQEVKRLGTKLGDIETYLFGLSHLSATMLYLTRFDEALAQAQEALDLAEQENHLKFQAELLTSVIPACHLRNGDFADAMAAVERGMEIALRIGSREDEASAAATQARFALLRGDFEDALASVRRAVAAADATGIPMVRALAHCVEGNCYAQIGGPMLERAVRIHSQTLELMAMPTGSVLATWLRSDMAVCALEAGAVDLASQFVDDALNTPNAAMHLMRPQALLAAIRLALVRQRPDEARSFLEELEPYVAERRMRDHVITVGLARSLVEAHSGRHDDALQHLERCAELAASLDFKRVLLDIRALQAHSLDALGRHDDGAEIRSSAEELAHDVAASLRGLELRAAFLSGSRALLAL